MEKPTLQEIYNELTRKYNTAVENIIGKKIFSLSESLLIDALHDPREFFERGQPGLLEIALAKLTFGEKIIYLGCQAKGPVLGLLDQHRLPERPNIRLYDFFKKEIGIMKFESSVNRWLYHADFFDGKKAVEGYYHQPEIVTRTFKTEADKLCTKALSNEKMLEKLMK